MNVIKYRVSLDLSDTLSQITIKAKKLDSACQIHITLTEKGKIYHIGEGCYATFNAKKSDGNFIYDNCTIEDNTIVYDFATSIDEDGIAQISACEGIVECEVTLYNANGEQLTSPRFTLFIDGTVYNGEEIISSSGSDVIKDLIKEVEDALEDISVDIDTSLFASAIQNKVSGDVISVSDVSALDHTVKVQLSGEEVENLLPSPYVEPFPMHTYNGDGSLVINGIVPSDNYMPLIVYISYSGDTLEKGTYTLDLGTKTSQVYLDIALTDANNSTYENYQTDNTGKITFTVGDYNVIETLTLRPTNGTTIENLLIKPMLYKAKESLFDTPTPSTNQDDIDYHSSVAISVKMELKDWTTYTVQFKCNKVGVGLHHHPLLTDSNDTSSKVTTGEVQTVRFTTGELSGEYPHQILYHDGYWDILCYDAYVPADIEFTDLAISEGNTIVNTNDYSQVKLYRYGVNSSVNKETYTPNADGTVDVPSLAPYMSLVTDKCGLTIEATYNLDTKDYVDKNKGGGVSGENGATFIPNVSADGVISWTNDKGLANPTPVNIKGEQGEKGDKGDKGDPYTLTETDKAEIVASVISALPVYNGEVVAE